MAWLVDNGNDAVHAGQAHRASDVEYRVSGYEGKGNGIDRARTDDLLRVKQALFRLSYDPVGLRLLVSAIYDDSSTRMTVCVGAGGHLVRHIQEVFLMWSFGALFTSREGSTEQA